MAKLIYSMLTSLDGYTEDERGDFGWGAPDEAVHSYINELASSVGTYLYGYAVWAELKERNCPGGWTKRKRSRKKLEEQGDGHD